MTTQSPDYVIKFYEPDGTFLHEVDGWLRLDIVLKVNHYGALVLDVPDNFPRSLFSKDNRIRVFRDGVQVGQTDFFLRKWEIFVNESKEEFYKLTAYSALYLLTSRVIPYADVSQSEKTDFADDMLKEIVLENMAGSAGTARQFSDFSIEADEGFGRSVEKEFPYAEVMKIAKELGQPNLIFFDIITDSNGDLQLVTAEDQLGEDKTSEIVLSVHLDNLKNLTITYDYTDEITTVYVGGTVSDAKTVEEVRDIPRETATQWSRREKYVDTQLTTTQALQDEGDWLLNTFEIEPEIFGEIQQTDTLRFMEDWDHGDKVTIMHNEIKEEVILTPVHITVQNKTEIIQSGIQTVQGLARIIPELTEQVQNISHGYYGGGYGGFNTYTEPATSGGGGTGVTGPAGPSLPDRMRSLLAADADLVNDWTVYSPYADAAIMTMSETGVVTIDTVFRNTSYTAGKTTILNTLPWIFTPISSLGGGSTGVYMIVRNTAGSTIQTMAIRIATTLIISVLTGKSTNSSMFLFVNGSYNTRYVDTVYRATANGEWGGTSTYLPEYNSFGWKRGRIASNLVSILHGHIRWEGTAGFSNSTDGTLMHTIGEYLSSTSYVEPQTDGTFVQPYTATTDGGSAVSGDGTIVMNTSRQISFQAGEADVETLTQIIVDMSDIEYLASA